MGRGKRESDDIAIQNGKTANQMEKAREEQYRRNGQRTWYGKSRPERI
jgi:hypothetical protein